MGLGALGAATFCTAPGAAFTTGGGSLRLSSTLRTAAPKYAQPSDPKSCSALASVAAGVFYLLLGLVGTVIGMIETFQSITESGSGDPKLMAAGIGKAMIATVLGLGIAIPLLFINSALASRSKRLVQILDQQSTGLLAETLEARNGAAHA